MNNITRTLVATCALIALSPVAPAAAQLHNNQNIRSPHIHRAVRVGNVPTIHQRVRAFNDHARKQINSNNNTWRHVSHCSGVVCSYSLQY